ncbi:hypothetical protein ABES35_16590 [Bacillus subtilis]|uniref:hypothetical protein n=1 Tax=Bacillus subtilis TaxID=1423 RepID=UPI000FFE1C05|nr:hypothetical protein [Bacillus subtilis]MEC2403284.1 hypothetical protein [Bacillus subtilis]MED4659465.1 hypothetical protein [Bacillus subtilis]MED4663770.1 hypothetical protein [Bacillus subtilis]NCT24041.1 hypothetical protein [Bacillus subtilis subsp. subtilis]QAT57994.1 hypothetical protein EQW70_11630 [Bacillus subtilis]
MAKERKFSVHGKVYTLVEYGKHMLEKSYKESDGATKNPYIMSKEEIEDFAIDLIQERIFEDEEVFECV